MSSLLYVVQQIIVILRQIFAVLKQIIVVLRQIIRILHHRARFYQSYSSSRRRQQEIPRLLKRASIICIHTLCSRHVRGDTASKTLYIPSRSSDKSSGPGKTVRESLSITFIVFKPRLFRRQKAWEIEMLTGELFDGGDKYRMMGFPPDLGTSLFPDCLVAGSFTLRKKKRTTSPSKSHEEV